MITPSENSSKKIEILPEHIIDQIKAGEVLERPASLIKELIENSLDAGSTEIDLHLIANGMDLISIIDNGHGMDFDNLPYAFLRHATSKLKSFEDIYRLRSFGFRGEALASIAASSRITCTSQPKNLEAMGGKIIINGGLTELHIPQQAQAQGTSIYIKDLFFNTPARLKFIKSKVSEKSALKKMIYSFVLSNPHVTFSIKWDEKEKEVFRATGFDKHIHRVSQVFYGKKIENQSILHFVQSYENYRVEVFFTKETHTTPQYRHHYLFVNNRFFQDKSLHSAILRNTEFYWKHGESGHYVILIHTPPEDIDVNVHPNKTHIKFLRSDVVYSLLVNALKSAIKESFPTQMPATYPSGFSGNGESDLNLTQSSFFSKEENQDFDLENFSSRQYSDHSSLGNSIYGQENEIRSTHNKFTHLCGEYFLVKLEKFYLFNLKMMIANFLAENIHNSKSKEESATPLLISEPFNILKGSIDKQFEELKLIGFEFDRLNNEYIVLRTMPSFLPQALLQFSANHLLKYFTKYKTSEFSADQFKKYLTEADVEDNFYNDVPYTFIEAQLSIFKNDLVEMTPEKLHLFFKV